MKAIYSLAMLLLLAACSAGTSSEWISLFDGQSLDGWKASENADSWKIENGALVTAGERSHLFYEGELLDHNFRNFEFVFLLLIRTLISAIKNSSKNGRVQGFNSPAKNCRVSSHILNCCYSTTL